MVMSTGSDSGKDVVQKKSNNSSNVPPFDPSGSDELHSGFSIQRAPVARHLQERKLR